MSVIDEIKSGKEEALVAIYKEHRDAFINWAGQNYSCSSDDAKDVFQNTIIKFYNNVTTGKLTELTSDLRTYLFAIGKYELLNRIRKSNSTVTLPIDSVINGINEPNHTEFMDQEEQEFVKETVKKHLALQCEDCQKVLDLYYFQEKSMQEIANEMGYKNADVAKKKKYECFKKLAKMVKDNLKLIVL